MTPNNSEAPKNQDRQNFAEVESKNQGVPTLAQDEKSGNYQDTLSLNKLPLKSGEASEKLLSTLSQPKNSALVKIKSRQIFA